MTTEAAPPREGRHVRVAEMLHTVPQVPQRSEEEVELEQRRSLAAMLKISAPEEDVGAEPIRPSRARQSPQRDAVLGRILPEDSDKRSSSEA